MQIVSQLNIRLNEVNRVQIRIVLCLEGREYINGQGRGDVVLWSMGRTEVKVNVAGVLGATETSGT